MVSLTEAQGWNWPLILRILSVCCGVGTVFAGIFSLLTSWQDFPAAFIINLYMIVFAVLIVLAELRVRPMLKSFQFLQTYLGRGLFYLFVATICFVYPSAGNIVMGCVLIANGGVHLYMVFTSHPAYKKELQELAEKGYITSEIGQHVETRMNDAAKESMKTQIFGKKAPKSDAPPSI